MSSNLKDIIICNESIDFKSKQLFCSTSLGDYLNGGVIKLEKAASTLEDARTKTIEYLQKIPGNGDIQLMDIKVNWGNLDESNLHKGPYVSPASTFRFRTPKYIMVSVPEKYKIKDTSSSVGSSVGGYRRYKKRRMVRKTTRRSKKSSRRTRRRRNP